LKGRFSQEEIVERRANGAGKGSKFDLAVQVFCVNRWERLTGLTFDFDSGDAFSLVALESVSTAKLVAMAAEAIRVAADAVNVNKLVGGML